jgi:hypothetical protein
MRWYLMQRFPNQFIPNNAAYRTGATVSLVPHEGPDPFGEAPGQ